MIEGFKDGKFEPSDHYFREILIAEIGNERVGASYDENALKKYLPQFSTK